MFNLDSLTGSAETPDAVHTRSSAADIADTSGLAEGIPLSINASNDHRQANLYARIVAIPHIQPPISTGLRGQRKLAPNAYARNIGN